MTAALFFSEKKACIAQALYIFISIFKEFRYYGLALNLTHITYGASIGTGSHRGIST